MVPEIEDNSSYPFVGSCQLLDTLIQVENLDVYDSYDAAIYRLHWKKKDSEMFLLNMQFRCLLQSLFLHYISHVLFIIFLVCIISNGVVCGQNYQSVLQELVL